MKILSICVGVLLSCNIHAEIYKLVDSEGNISYSNRPVVGGSKINIEPLTPMSGGNYHPVSKRDNGEKLGSLNVTPPTQDAERLKILTEELTSETQALNQAKEAYKEAESNPEMFTSAEGKRFRNVAKFDEKMSAALSEVKTHQHNVEALNQEISKLTKGH